MKFLSLLLLINSFLYAEAKHFRGTAAPHDTVINKKEPIAWIDDFKLFRTAVYQNDKATVKQYFKFPLYNDGNELWFLVLSEKEYDKISGNKKNPFLEKDFDKYYSKIFPLAFKKSILKIKTDDLFKSGNAESAEFKESNTSYKMYATYDKKLRTLSLNLAYNTVTKDKDGNIEDGGESNVIYNFVIDKTGHIFFKEVRLAG